MKIIKSENTAKSRRSALHILHQTVLNLGHVLTPETPGDDAAGKIVYAVAKLVQH